MPTQRPAAPGAPDAPGALDDPADGPGEPDGPGERPGRHRGLEILRGTDHGTIAASRYALPLIAPARHVVVDSGADGRGEEGEGGHVLLQLHRGHGYHTACDGNVIAYGADAVVADEFTAGGIHARGAGLWSAQFVGTARLVVPTPAELRLFRHTPCLADGVPYDPVYLRVAPRFVTVHRLERAPVTVCQTVQCGDPQ